MKNRKQLMLSDIVDKDDSLALNVLLEDKFRKLYKLKPTDELSSILFENSIKANDNFYITEKGIGFTYNPYAIAAYVYGEISLFIPFSQMNGLLKDDFVSFLQN
jgi:hypothetical protein